jgi:hypothetical protein
MTFYGWIIQLKPQASKSCFLYPLLTRNLLKHTVQLVAKKTGNENFPNVNLVLSICQLIVYLTIPVKQF